MWLEGRYASIDLYGDIRATTFDSKEINMGKTGVKHILKWPIHSIRSSFRSHRCSE